MDEIEQPEKKKSVLPKLILMLTIVCVGVAAAIVYGVKYFGMMKDAQAVVEVPAEEPMPPPPPPEDPSITLTRTILTGTPEERKTALDSLIAMEAPQPEAMVILTQAVSASTETPRSEILAAFGKLAVKNPEAVPALVAALGDKIIRVDAINALGEAGPAATSAVPALKKIAANKKEALKVKKAAGAALMKISPPKKAVAKKKGTRKKKA